MCDSLPPGGCREGFSKAYKHTPAIALSGAPPFERGTVVITNLQSPFKSLLKIFKQVITVFDTYR